MIPRRPLVASIALFAAVLPASADEIGTTPKKKDDRFPENASASDDAQAAVKKLAVAPGMGGSQRLTRAVGKAKAMEMCLTGRMMGAEEAERAGLVSRIVPAAELVEEAVKTAAAIAAMAPLAVLANKEMVNAAFETGLAQGVQFERRLFHGLFGSADQKEGMAAFVEKRPGTWTGK